MSALLMAVVWRGMTPRELSAWTTAMVASGERMDLSGTGRPGRRQALLRRASATRCRSSSRRSWPRSAWRSPSCRAAGSGHTGGTLDKLESIPGWRGELTREQFLGQLRDVGAVIGSAGESLAPADKALYALRDVTATVESIPLIASSIMSKKIAGGADAVLLDVKVGAGAFMKELEPARELARTMVRLGADAGVRTVCLLTSMEAPLGRGIGNALEVAEAVEVLQGGGPADLREVCLAVAREMLALGGVHDDPEPALADGRALEVWRRMVAAQGGDPDAPLPQAPLTEVVEAPRDGWLVRLDALAVGTAAWRLGAGRARKEDDVDPGAGLVLGAGLGERVRAGRRSRRCTPRPPSASPRAAPRSRARTTSQTSRRRPCRWSYRRWADVPQLVESPCASRSRGQAHRRVRRAGRAPRPSRSRSRHMRSPAGWEEPAQAPEFDEVTLVLGGAVHVEHDGGTLVVSAGQAVLTRAGERVRYTTPEGAEYVAVCLPAFAPDTVNREGE
jgi:thymidine phosphorylase